MEPYWDYEDVGSFFFVLVLLNALVHLAVRIHLLHSTELVHPGVGIQSAIILLLGTSLYAILKLRYRGPVIMPLGWRIPNRFYSAVAILGGVIAALAITCVTHSRGDVMPTIPAKEFFLLGLFLGPILESRDICNRYRYSVRRLSYDNGYYALDVVYSDRAELWFASRGVEDDNGSGLDACHLQFDSLRLREVLIPLRCCLNSELSYRDSGNL